MLRNAVLLRPNSFTTSGPLFLQLIVHSPARQVVPSRNVVFRAQSQQVPQKTLSGRAMRARYVVRRCGTLKLRKQLTQLAAQPVPAERARRDPHMDQKMYQTVIRNVTHVLAAVWLSAPTHNLFKQPYNLQQADELHSSNQVGLLGEVAVLEALRLAVPGSISDRSWLSHSRTYAGLPEYGLVAPFDLWMVRVMVQTPQSCMAACMHMLICTICIVHSSSGTALYYWLPFISL